MLERPIGLRRKQPTVHDSMAEAHAGENSKTSFIGNKRTGSYGSY